MNFAICSEIFQGWKIEDTLAGAARLGYAGVEIAPFTLANSVTDISATERQAMREAAARSGIAITGIHWVLVKPEGLYINHPDRSIRERTAKYFCDLVDFCAGLGGKVMVVASRPGTGRRQPSGTQSREPSNGRSPFASSLWRRRKRTSSTPQPKPFSLSSKCRRPVSSLSST
jgi:sugar phosphate isomerase/epimerase